LKKASFSLLELIVSITLLGLLALLAIPKFQTSNLERASHTLIQHLRYTKSLALKNDNFTPNDKNYYKKVWQIIFGRSAYSEQYYAYTIFRDDIGKSSGNPDINEIAKNPNDPTKLLSGGFTGTIRTSDSRATKEMNLGKRYGIVDIMFEGGCKYYTSKRLSFDYLGRPLKGNPTSYKRPYQRLMSSSCIIRLCADSECNQNTTVTIEPITGYIH
jgi:type II secretory pathway pseudopilin PulG